MIDLPYIRCVTCGKVIGHLHSRVEDLRTKNYTNEEIFEELGLSRPCCRNSVMNPPKYSMVGIADEEKTHPMNLSTEEKGISHDRTAGLRNRLSKIKDASGQDKKSNKKPMCYLAI